jgi:uncharacterized membrane protein
LVVGIALYDGFIASLALEHLARICIKVFCIIIIVNIRRDPRATTVIGVV